MRNADYGKYEKGSFPIESKLSLNWARRLILTGQTEKRWQKEGPLTLNFLTKNWLQDQKQRPLQVLDFGIGIGRIAVPLLKNYPNLKLIGVDASFSMLKLAKKYIPKKYFTEGRIKLYHTQKIDNLKPNSADLILVIYVFQHIYKEELEKILPKLYCFLKNSGRLFVISTYQGDDNRGRIVNIKRLISKFFKLEAEISPQQGKRKYCQWMKIAGYGDWQKGWLANGRCRKFQAIFSKRKTLEPNLAEMVEEEKKILEDFFGQKIKVPNIPCSQEQVKYWQGLGFDLHYLPAIRFSQEKKFPSWYQKPHQIFYKKIKQGKISSNSLWLPGSWILIDSRPKPKKEVFWLTSSNPFFRGLKSLGFDVKRYFKKMKKQQYENDSLLPIFKKFGWSSRYVVSWQDFQKFKEQIANLLKVKSSQLRFPRLIEFNFLGNAFYPEWLQTQTWEWLEDKFGNYQLAGGCGSLGIIGWDPPDYWSTILAFRPLIILS